MITKRILRISIVDSNPTMLLQKHYLQCRDTSCPLENSRLDVGGGLTLLRGRALTSLAGPRVSPAKLLARIHASRNSGPLIWEFLNIRVQDDRFHQGLGNIGLKLPFWRGFKKFGIPFEPLEASHKQKQYLQTKHSLQLGLSVLIRSENIP